MERRSKGAPQAAHDEQALTAAAAMFRALADPERLRLLVRLSSGEACVTDLADDDKLTTVSARLQALHAVHLLTRRRDARHIYYALADHHVLHLVESAMDHAGERRTPARRSRPLPATKKKGTRA
jgi:ArsR family transcriptional regulator